jgi:hypothetical protein
MEELRTTEVLDKEILEDARKKAHRALGAAEESIRSMDERWNRKIDRALREAEKKFAARIENNREEVMARLPLDKRRVRSEKIESLLVAEAASYFAGLSRDRLLSVLEAELADRAGELEAGGGPEYRVRFRFLSAAELEAILARHVPGYDRSWTLQEDPLFSLPGTLPALVIDIPPVRIVASVDRVMETLLQDKRGELVNALLGDGASDSPAAGASTGSTGCTGGSTGGIHD